MTQRKVMKMLPYIAGFVGLAAGIFMWRCALTAFFWAGWGGFGDVSMVYNARGERAEFFFVDAPVLLLFILLLIRLGSNIRKKASISRYGKDLLFLIAAVGVGIILFYMPEPRQMIVDAISHGIVQAGWMEYPVP